MSDTPHQHRVQPYTADELNTRIAEQSVDTNRLAATVAGMLTTVTALAEWANKQIVGEGTTNPEPDAAKADDTSRRRKQ
jgi:hypothetical protein